MEEPSFIEENFQANDQSLFAEMHGGNFPGTVNFLIEAHLLYMYMYKCPLRFTWF